MKQDRRGFLTGAGAATAALALGGLPFAARAATDKLKIGVVGSSSRIERWTATAQAAIARPCTIYLARLTSELNKDLAPGETRRNSIRSAMAMTANQMPATRMRKPKSSRSTLLTTAITFNFGTQPLRW